MTGRPQTLDVAPSFALVHFNPAGVSRCRAFVCERHIRGACIVRGLLWRRSVVGCLIGVSVCRRPVWYNDFVLQKLDDPAFASSGGRAAAVVVPTTASESNRSATRHTCRNDAGQACTIDSSTHLPFSDDDGTISQYHVCTQEEGDAILVPHEWGHVRCCVPTFAFCLHLVLVRAWASDPACVRA